MEKMNASYFKARCLGILDRVRETGEPIVILKRGRPVAELWPPSNAEARYPQSELKGTVTVIGDIVGPVVPAEHWDSLAGAGGSAAGTPADRTDREADTHKRALWRGGE